jgi:hypothetical protein
MLSAARLAKLNDLVVPPLPAVQRDHVVAGAESARGDERAFACYAADGNTGDALERLTQIGIRKLADVFGGYRIDDTYGFPLGVHRLFQAASQACYHYLLELVSRFRGCGRRLLSVRRACPHRRSQNCRNGNGHRVALNHRLIPPVPKLIGLQSDPVRPPSRQAVIATIRSRGRRAALPPARGLRSMAARGGRHTTFDNETAEPGRSPVHRHETAVSRRHFRKRAHGDSI